MARRKKNFVGNRSAGSRGIKMNTETKRGILVVLLLAASALIFLSFFHIAGNLGVWIYELLSTFFGIDRFLVPIVLIIMGASMAYPERGTLSTWNYFGLFFFFLSFNALLNLFLVDRPEPFTTDLTLAGGYLGQFLAILLPNFVGFW